MLTPLFIGAWRAATRYALPLFMSPRLFYPMTEEIARPFSGKVCKNGLSRFFIDISRTCCDSCHSCLLNVFRPFFEGVPMRSWNFRFSLNLMGNFLQMLGKSAPLDKVPRTHFWYIDWTSWSLERLILWLKMIKCPIFYRIFKACWNFLITSAIRRRFFRR